MDQITGMIRRWMVAQSMSLNALAERTAIPKTTLLRRFNHPSNFTVGELAVIADTLGCRVLDLWPMNGDDSNGEAGAA